MTAPGEPITRLRVLLIEDNAYTRLGVQTFLRAQPDIDVVGEGDTGNEVLALAAKLNPQVVVMDLKMPGMDGVAATRILVKANPDARVLILTHHDGEDDVFNALRAGARGFLTKEAPGSELLTAIRTVAAGSRYLPPEIAGRIAEGMMRPGLTPRERQILDELFKGSTNREIGAALTLTERTVGMYVGTVMSKLGARTRTEAVAIGLQRGLLKAK